MQDQLCDAMYRQIVNEMASANLYLNIASYFDNQSLSGFSHWMRKQAHEEHSHAMRLYDHMLERREMPMVGTVPEMAVPGKSPLKIMLAVLDHEKMVTTQIHELMDIARTNKDYACEVMLHWFIDEQTEEVNSVEQIVDRLAIAGEDGSGLIVIDSELKSRE